VILKEAAELLGNVTAETLRIQIGKGKLRATKHGRDWWVEPREVERYRRDSAGRNGRPAGAKDKRPRARSTPLARPTTGR
jgi:hypothetical protein